MHPGRASLKPREFYEKQARDLIKDRRVDKQLTYEQLAARMEAHGARMEPRALINKINRGRFSFAFALQVLAAMDEVSLRLPNALGPDRADPAKNGGWVSPKAPKTKKNEAARRSSGEPAE